MKIIHYSEAHPQSFDGDTVRGVTGRVAIGQADGATNFCMRVFELSPEGHTPRHQHEWEHEIFFHAGKGEIYKDGQWEPWAQEILDRFKGVAYAEISPSGTGVKLTTRAKKPEGARCQNNKGVECYDSARFWTWTQECLGDGYREIGWW